VVAEQQGATKAGWYPSPEDPALLRFWDGELWTERVRVGSTRPQVPLTAPDEHIGGAEIITTQLGEGEEIKAGFRGRSRMGVGRRWVAATNERLIIVKRKGLRGWQTETFDYGDVESVGIIDACCAYIKTGGDKIGFTVQGTSSNESLADVVSYVRFRRKFDDFETIDVRSLPRPGHGVHGARHSTFPAPTQVAPLDVDSLIEQIRKLDALRNDGLLTDAEFEAQKRKLLGESS